MKAENGRETNIRIGNKKKQVSFESHIAYISADSGCVLRAEEIFAVDR